MINFKIIADEKDSTSFTGDPDVIIKSGLCPGSVCYREGNGWQ